MNQEVNPLISIIVPVYNVEKYLKRCVDSILSQTYKNFECILVDDGSTDSSGKLCDEYANRDSRIKVIHKKNGGQADARNVGMDTAIGEYIGFVDSDDRIHPQMYEILINTAIKENTDMTVCKYSEVEENTCESIYINYDINKIEYETYYGKEMLDEYFTKNFCYRCSTVVWTKLYKKKVLQKLRFPVGVYYEDSAIVLDTIERSEKIALIDAELYFYLQRENSTMHSQYSPKWFQGVYNNNNNNRFFKERGYDIQLRYAMDDYLTRFCKDKFAVYLLHPEFKKEFKPINREFKKYIFKLLRNPVICNMKKAAMLLLFVNIRFSYKLCTKYFPECIHEFMRKNDTEQQI